MRHDDLTEDAPANDEDLAEEDEIEGTDEEKKRQARQRTAAFLDGALVPRALPEVVPPPKGGNAPPSYVLMPEWQPSDMAWSEGGASPDEIETRLAEINSRLDQIESHRSQPDRSPDDLETRLDNSETRLDNIETRLDNIDRLVRSQGTRRRTTQAQVEESQSEQQRQQELLRQQERQRLQELKTIQENTLRETERKIAELYPEGEPPHI